MVLGFIRILKILTFVRFIQEKYNLQTGKVLFIYYYTLLNNIYNILYTTKDLIWHI